MAQPNNAPPSKGSGWKNTARDIFAGTVAGINVTLIGHPFDTLKVRLQTQPHAHPLYAGLSDCFLKTIKWEGFGGLYSGVTSPLMGQIFFRTLLFGAFGESKRQLGKKGYMTTFDYFIAGGFAWGFGTLAECPIDVLKSQLQVQIIKSKTTPGYVAPYNDIGSCLRVVTHQNGLKGLFQGFLPHITRNLPAGAVHLGTFEMTRAYFAQQKGIPTSQLTMWHTLFAGGVGGFLFWFLFFPLDVVKSSIQSDNIIKSERKYKGVIDAYKKLYQEGGIKRFYKGFLPCMLRAIPANSVMLWSVAFITDHL